MIDAPGRPRRRFRRLWIVLLVVLAVLAALAVAIDLASRPFAEQYVEDRIESSLPEGVQGNVDVQIGGLSVIAQYLSGRFDEVDLASTALTVGGIPLQADVHLEGVPVDQTRPIRSVSGKVLLDEEDLDALIAAQGNPGHVRLTGGNVEYTGTTQILGLVDVDYLVITRPELSGGRLQLSPLKARLGNGAIDIDITALLPVVAPGGLSICLAENLPDTLAVDSLVVGNGAVAARFSGRSVLVTEEGLARRGACS